MDDAFSVTQYINALVADVSSHSSYFFFILMISKVIPNDSTLHSINSFFKPISVTDAVSARFSLGNGLLVNMAAVSQFNYESLVDFNGTKDLTLYTNKQEK